MECDVNKTYNLLDGIQHTLDAHATHFVFREKKDEDIVFRKKCIVFVHVLSLETQIYCL